MEAASDAGTETSRRHIGDMTQANLTAAGQIGGIGPAEALQRRLRLESSPGTATPCKQSAAGEQPIRSLDFRRPPPEISAN